MVQARRNALRFAPQEFCKFAVHNLFSVSARFRGFDHHATARFPIEAAERVSEFMNGEVLLIAVIAVIAPAADCVLSGEGDRTALPSFARAVGVSGDHAVGGLADKSGGENDNTGDVVKVKIVRTQQQQCRLAGDGVFHFFGHSDPIATFPVFFGDENFRDAL